MRAVIQRVCRASVEVDGKTQGQIGPGLLVYLSVAKGDSQTDAQFLAEKLINLRIFPDDQNKMNLSVRDVGGAILLISQFTLHGDCRKGRRPGFDLSAEPDLAKQLYQHTIDLIRNEQINCQTGIFAAHMHVSSVNDGPVTFLLDSTRLF